MKNTNKFAAFFSLTIFFLFTNCNSGDIFEGSGDIGNVKAPGSVGYDRATQTYTLTGAGENMWFETDAFFMTWKKVSGDFNMRTDIRFEGTGVNEHRKVGIIIRENLTPGAKYADVAVHGDGLTSLQYRPVENDITEEVPSQNVAPTRIYLERTGNKIRIKTGYNNLPETFDAEIEFDLPKECYVGLFICSHESDVVEKAYFSNVIFKKL